VISRCGPTLYNPPEHCNSENPRPVHKILCTASQVFFSTLQGFLKDVHVADGPLDGMCIPRFVWNEGAFSHPRY